MLPTCALFLLLVFSATAFHLVEGDSCKSADCRFLDDVTDTENANNFLQISKNATRSELKDHNTTSRHKGARGAGKNSSASKAKAASKVPARHTSGSKAASSNSLSKAKSETKAAGRHSSSIKSGAKASSSMSASMKALKVQAAAAERSAQRRAKANITSNSSVKSFDCNKYRTPVQVMMDLEIYKGGYIVAELDTELGEYREIWRTPYNKTSPQWQDINGCGINPVDSKVYCAIFGGGAFIVRLDAKTIEYVAMLPWKIFNSGAFGPSGNFYVSDARGYLMVAEDLASQPGSETLDKKSLLDLRKGKSIRPQGWFSTSDLVAVEWDFEGAGGGEGEYVISAYGPSLQIVKYNVESGKFGGSWVLDLSPARWDNVFGAGWNFNSKLYFASNRGAGVYEIPLADINLDSDEKIEMPKIIGNEATTNNDGFNCMNLGSPFITQIMPFDCTANPGPIQLIKVDMDEADFTNWRLPAKEYVVAMANFTTGANEEIYKIPSNITDPAFVSLNAAGINPRDNIAYGTLKLEWWKSADEPSPFYIVRFDHGKIEFLAGVHGDSDAIAGSFDSNGTYFAAAHPHLWSFPGVDRMKGYANYTSRDLPWFTKDDALLELKDRQAVADMVMVFGTFDGGQEAEYMLSINQHQELSITNLKTQAHTVLPTNKLHSAEDGGGNFGAGWNFNGNVYFSSNDGEGVWKVPLTSVDTLTNSEVTLEKVGESITIHDNDGMNCMFAATPTAAK
mmetsp:Transcript_128919/g.234214  ORF Transcript_128919/g.234214 Transcript_128919/m.234214 type:complete len:736 (-) Transcript_128919:69-2276(-)